MKLFPLIILLLAGATAQATTLYVCDAVDAYGEKPNGTVVARLDPPLVKVTKPPQPEQVLMDDQFVYLPKPVKLSESRIIREGDESRAYMRWSWKNTADGTLLINGSFLRGDFFSAYGLIGVPKTVEQRFENCEPQ